MKNYETRIRASINELKAVFDEAYPTATISVVKTAGETLAKKIAQNPEVDRFSAAAALYELCLIDANAFFDLLMEETEEADKAAEFFLASSPKFLAELYAAVSLLS